MQLSWEKLTMLKIGFGHGWPTENLPHVVADFNLFASIKCFFSKIAKALNMNNFKAPLPQLQGKRDKIEVLFELLWKDSCN